MSFDLQNFYIFLKEEDIDGAIDLLEGWYWLGTEVGVFRPLAHGWWKDTRCVDLHSSLIPMSHGGLHLGDSVLPSFVDSSEAVGLGTFW